MRFYHCWKCMIEVTPSRRRLVRRVQGRVFLTPEPPNVMDAFCDTEIVHQKMLERGKDLR